MKRQIRLYTACGRAKLYQAGHVDSRYIYLQICWLHVSLHPILLPKNLIGPPLAAPKLVILKIIPQKDVTMFFD